MLPSKLPSQPGILQEVTSMARYISFSQIHGADPEIIISQLPDIIDIHSTVTGIGLPLVSALGASVPGLSAFPSKSGRGISIPSTQASLWCWLRGTDRGDLVHNSLELENRLASVFQADDIIDAFRYSESRDLTGYIDGTENPKGDDAVTATLVSEGGGGIIGSSFVVVQQWVHDLDFFYSHTADERDYMIGRRRSDNEEIDEAPETAHVKRTAQESFEPPAFVLRRSMPWCDANGQGLMFVAFGKSFAAYESLLNRMIGLEDNMVDSLFRFTRPVTGSYYWCPPIKDGKLDLSALS